MNGVMAAWGVEVGIIAIRDFVASKRPPLPSELLATFVLFGGLGVISSNSAARRPAAAVAWGIVVATLLSARVDFLKPVGDFLTGSAGGGAAAPGGAASPTSGASTSAPAGPAQSTHYLQQRGA